MRGFVGEAGSIGARLDIAIKWVLAGLLAFAPLAYGAVEAWSEFIVIAAAGSIALLLALKWVWTRSGLIWSWTYIPILLFILLAVLQLAPLPKPVIATVSPHTANIKTDLLADLSDSEDSRKEDKYITLSFYLLATRHDLRLVLAAAAIFVSTIHVFRELSSIRQILLVITMTGATVASLALIQDFFRTQFIYGPLGTVPNSRAGPFVHHSHFGQFMNLSIGCACAFSFLTLHRRQMVLGLVTIFLCLAALLASLTRGGVLSMLIAALGTAFTLILREQILRRTIPAILLGTAIVVALLSGNFNTLQHRFAALKHFEIAEAGRWQMLQDIIAAWQTFPVFGFGLGNHEYVFPMFDRSGSALLATYGENEYAQVLEETGILGLSIVALFTGIIWLYHAKVIRRGTRQLSFTAGSLGLGLLAIQLHSLSDFGQHVPANTCLTAVIYGLVVSLYRLIQFPSFPRAPSFNFSIPAKLCGFLLIAMVFIWSII
jgi:O-antigen ligase